MPTGRGGGAGDTICLRNHLDEAEAEMIQRGIRGDRVAEILNPARTLLKKPDFWRNTSDGLAAFATDQWFQTYRLPLHFADQTTVGPRFAIKPLLPWLEGDGRFYILALSQNHIRLLEGTAHSVQRLDPRHLPADMKDALRAHDTDAKLNLHTHHGAEGRAMQAVFHGHGVGVDDHKKDLLSYFRQIDRGLHAGLQHEHGPLVVATVEYLLPIYRSANTYPHMVAEGVLGNPDRVSDSELRDRAWPLVEPFMKRGAERAMAQYRQLAGTGRTTSNIAELLPAVHRGEIATLLLVPGQPVWGRFDPVAGLVEEHATRESGDEDLADLTAIHALRHHRIVHVVEPTDDFRAVAGIRFVPLAHHGK